MHKKDYILAQFEEFGRVMALILTFKNQRDWIKFDNEIQNAIQKYTQFDIEQILNFSLIHFDQNILISEQLDLNQKKKLAQLLFEKLMAQLMKNENTLLLKEKCVAIYKHLQNNSTKNEFNLDVHYKLEFLNTI